MAEPTLTDLAAQISRLMITVNSRFDSIDEDLSDLINKVDEINLPTGEGFSTTYES